MRIALYTRVSTSEQATDGNSLDVQIESLRSYALSRKWEIWDEYIDKGFSGGSENRPELTRMMHDANEKRFEAVLVCKLDRFFRDLRYQVNYIHTLKDLSITFISTHENLDTSTPNGNLMLNLMGSIAEQERHRIGERIKDTRRYLASKNQWSCGRTPFGYRFNKEDKQLEINKTESDVIQFMYNHYLNDNIGIIKLAELLNKENKITPRLGRRKTHLWNQSAVRYVLTHPAYKGEISPEWKFKTPVIIDPKIWQLVQNKLTTNQRFKPCKIKREFQGLLKCAVCGHTLRIGYNHSNLDNPFYECPSRLKALHVDGSERCTLPRFEAINFDKDISNQVVSIFNNPDELKKHILNTYKSLEIEIKDLEKRLYPMQAEIDRINGDMERADTMYKLHRMDSKEYTAVISGLETKKRNLEKQTKEIDPLLLSQYREKKVLVSSLSGMSKTEPLSYGMKHTWTAYNQNPKHFSAKLLEDFGDKGKDLAKAILDIDKSLFKTPRELLQKYGMKLIVYPDKVELKGNLQTGKSDIILDYR